MEPGLSSRIRDRYQIVLRNIAEATARAGRGPGTVKLVVVTKSQPLEVVREAIEAGASILGENYAEEAVAKIAALRETKVDWHMIGHVQSRKAEPVATHFSTLHSLDSVKLARRLNQKCQEMNRTLPVLLEINVSGESSKYGFPGWDPNGWSNLAADFRQISEFHHLHIQGLMTMPPIFDNTEEVRPYFQKLCKLREFLKERIPHIDWTELSMGTSMDYMTAIEEGATFVRIGEAILGPRPI